MVLWVFKYDVVIFAQRIHMSVGFKQLASATRRFAQLLFSMAEPKAKIVKLDPDAARKLRIIWVDCEMTGLDIENNHLLEVACVITEGDRDLTVVEESESLVIHRSEEILESMGDWCKQHFAKNGLLDSIRKSKLSLDEAESILVELVKKHTPAGVCPLAGSTVSEDRRWLRKFMPSFAQHLHYRTIDVSSVKELCKRWKPEVHEKKPKSTGNHRALGDIRDSIELLRLYQKHFFLQ